MPVDGGTMRHIQAKCQKGKDCQGPGCKLKTGKTRDKRVGRNRGMRRMLESMRAECPLCPLGACTCGFGVI